MSEKATPSAGASAGATASAKAATASTSTTPQPSAGSAATAEARCSGASVSGSNMALMSDLDSLLPSQLRRNKGGDGNGAGAGGVLFGYGGAAAGFSAGGGTNTTAGSPSGEDGEGEDDDDELMELDPRAAEQMRREFLFSFGRLHQYAKTVRPQQSTAAGPGRAAHHPSGSGGATTTATTALDSLLSNDESLRAFVQHQQLAHLLPTAKKRRKNPEATVKVLDDDEDNEVDDGIASSAAADGAAPASLQNGFSTTATRAPLSYSNNSRAARSTARGADGGVDSDYYYPMMQGLINIIQNGTDDPRYARGEGSEDGGPSETTVAAQMECMRALFAAARRQAQAQVTAQREAAFLEDGTANAGGSAAKVDEGCGPTGDGEGYGGDHALPSGFAANMSRFFAELSTHTKASVDAALARGGVGDHLYHHLCRGGHATPQSGGGTGAHAASNVPENLNEERMLEMMRAMTELHDQVRYEDEGVELLTLQANMEDFRSRAARLSALSPTTLTEVAMHTAQLETSGDMLLELELLPQQVDDPTCLIISHRLGEVTAGAAAMLWWFMERKRSGPGGDQGGGPLPPDQDGAAELHRLRHRLRQELHTMSPEGLQQIGKYLTTSTLTDPNQVYAAISGVGVALLCSGMPLPLLLHMCEDFAISTSDEASMDRHVLPEALAEKIAAHLCPMRDGAKISLSHQPFIPRLQVHEHAPGSYTCTIDNASSMGRMPTERLLSNRFSCSKLKWRAAVVLRQGRSLSFQLWHRNQSPLRVYIMLRTSEPKKKKQRKSGEATTADAPTDAAAGADAKQTADNLRASSALFFENSVTSASGELVGFDDFLGLEAALASTTTSQHGLRTYNRADDRITFQLTVSLSNVDGTPLEASTANGKTTATPRARSVSGDGAPVAVDSTTCDESSVEREQRLIEEHSRAVAELIAAEIAAREELDDGSAREYRKLQNEECRAGQRALQKTRDRERKALLAKAGPSPELIKELERLTQSVQALKQSVAKMSKDKAKDERETAKVRGRVEDSQAQLTRLQTSLEERHHSTNELEKEIKASQARIAEKKLRVGRREQRRSQNKWLDLKRVLEPATTTTHHDALAISDFGSFLVSSQPQGPQSQQSISLGQFSTSTSVLPMGASSSAIASGAAVVSANTPSMPNTITAATVTSTPSGSNSPAAASTALVMDAGMFGGGSVGTGGGLSSAYSDTMVFSTRQGPAVSPSGFEQANSSGPPPPVFSTQPKLRSPLDSTDFGAALQSFQVSGSSAASSLATAPAAANVSGSHTGNNLAHHLTTQHHRTGSSSHPSHIGIGMTGGTISSPPPSFGGVTHPSMLSPGASSPPLPSGIPFGLAPSPFTTNPAASHLPVVGPSTPSAHQGAALDINAQTFNPAMGPGAPQGQQQYAQPPQQFAFTVTAGAGGMPSQGLHHASPLYQSGSGGLGFAADARFSVSGAVPPTGSTGTPPSLSQQQLPLLFGANSDHLSPGSHQIGGYTWGS